MADYDYVYGQRAEDYDLLVSREDYRGNLLHKIAELRPLAEIDVVEFGAGTGRVTRLLAPHVRSIRAFDAQEPMLAVARSRAQQLGHANCTFEVGSNDALPCEDACADLAIAGWTFGHLPGWHPDDWRERLAAVLAEMRRVLRPGGTAFIIDTLGTGRETPEAPSPGLAAYQAALEQEHGFTRHWIRTDYEFESVEEAERLARFFFGDGLGDKVVREKAMVLAECTGVWVG